MNEHLSAVILSLEKQGMFPDLFADKAYGERLDAEYSMLIDTSFLIEEEVKKITGLTSDELLTLERDVKFPRRVHPRIISFWKKEDVDKWVTGTLQKPVDGS